LFDQTAPFKLAKDPANLPEVGAILACCAQGMRAAAALLQPILVTASKNPHGGFDYSVPSSTMARTR
jgi:methionyl-tRNA synthetase